MLLGEPYERGNHDPRYANQSFCLICGKAIEQHSIEERIECIDAEDAKGAALPCPGCEKPIGQHSPDEIRTALAKAGTNRRS